MGAIDNASVVNSSHQKVNMEKLSTLLTKSTIEQMKRLAKRLGKLKGISHTKALDEQAQQHGFRQWSLLQRYAKKECPPDTIVESVALLDAPIETPVSTPSTPSTSAKQPKVKWLSFTQIGTKLALTLPKVKKAFIEHGYLDPTGTPTEKAISEDVVKIKMIENRYPKDSSSPLVVPFYLWMESFVEKEFAAPSEIDLFCHLTNRSHAEKRLEAAFVRAGTILGVDFNTYSLSHARKLGLTNREYDAIMESKFGGSYLIGGPTVLFLYDTPREYIKQVEITLMPLIDSISRKLLKINTEEAHFFKTACTRILAWLKKL